MSRQITEELAEKIARKLEATSLSSAGAHELMGIHYGGVLIASFGIRRGSEKDKGHDHVQKHLKVSTRFAKELGICTKSKEQWIAEMISKGHIDAQGPAAEPPTR